MAFGNQPKQVLRQGSRGDSLAHKLSKAESAPKSRQRASVVAAAIFQGKVKNLVER